MLEKFANGVSENDSALLDELGLEVKKGGSARGKGNESVVAGFLTEANPLFVDGASFGDVEGFAAGLEGLACGERDHSVDGIFTKRMKRKEAVEVQLLGDGATYGDFGSLKTVGLIGCDGVSSLIGDHDIEP